MDVGMGNTQITSSHLPNRSRLYGNFPRKDSFRVFELHQGDCLKIMPTIPDGSVDMILCDLPYGLTRNAWDSVISFESLWEQYLRIAKHNTAFVFTATQPFAAALVMSKPKLFRYEWVWSKTLGTGFLNAKKQPLRSHEQILVFYRDQPTYHPQMRFGFKPYTSKQGRPSSNYGALTPQHVTTSDGSRYPITILQFDSDKPKLHPTQKPVALMEYLVRTYTNEGDTVLDNCMGSGTTGVACKNLGRSFIGIEQDLAYFTMAEERIRGAERPSSFDWLDALDGTPMAGGSERPQVVN